MDCSHEYDLLMEMVQLEPPPATPIHPAAMGYKQRSKLFPCCDVPTERVRRRTRPRMFQWREREHSRIGGRKNVHLTSKFDTLARKKVTPWGLVLGLGTTCEQRVADERLINCTFLRRSLDSQTPQAVFHSQEEQSRDIIRLLQVTSRGHFLRSPGSPSSVPFCASWLNPTERWFSMSFYLSSRYHVSLWEVFSAKKSITRSRLHEPSIVQRAVPTAIQVALKKALHDDKKIHIEYLRDSLLWGVLMAEESPLSHYSLGIAPADWNSVWKAVSHIPIRQVHTPQGRFNSLIATEINVVIATELQNMLISNANGESQSVKSSISNTRRKKKKYKRKRDKKKVTILEQMQGKEVQFESKQAHPTSTLDFPNNQTPPRERNKNIMLVLTILENVVEAVFAEVGLEPTPPFEEEETTKKQIAEKNTEMSVTTITEKKVDTTIADSIPESPHRDDFKRDGTDATSNESLGVRNFASGGGMFPPSPFSPNYTPGIAWTTFGEAQHTSAFQRLKSFPSAFHGGNASPFFHPIPSDKLSVDQEREDEPLNGWPFMTRYQGREQSILSDFFRAQQQRNKDDDDEDDDDEKLMVASTAASISSSTYKDHTVLAEADEIEKVGDTSGDEGHIDTIEEHDDDNAVDEDIVTELVSVTAEMVDQAKVDTFEEQIPQINNPHGDTITANGDIQVPPASPRSPSPEAPLTPPPTLSPILVSLADLRNFQSRLSLSPERRRSKVHDSRSYASAAGAAAGSLPSSPIPQEHGLGSSWSRDDIRIKSFRDDQLLRQKKKPLLPQRSSSGLQSGSHRTAPIKSLARPIAASKATTSEFRSQVMAAVARDSPRDLCARSETAVDGQREDQQWPNDFRRSDEFDNKSVTKDETTTITSALSQREPEETASLREERNAYRDMCLTLGAEVAKLNALLAAHQATTNIATPIQYHEPFGHPLYGPSSFDPTGMKPFFHGMKRAKRLGPMSDAGLHRGGDHESQVSEDDMFEAAAKPRTEMVRQVSSGATMALSDVSVDFNNSNSALQSGGPNCTLPVLGSGLQSRLAKDMFRFLEQTSIQLKKQDSARRAALERFSRLVTAIWPRAQVKLYGSHISGLCLPSSDLDLVVCLPAVHKNAPALAPGVLEGRNAINESSQRLLARELKGESWIDPRSIKLIERTVVPVIKVATKDTRARVLHLDISFDSPEHHGLLANEMVASTLEEIPMIRPLMLILKQFLLDRGLLTAYTGGVSSYCLFLMVARYLQEQPRSVGDCGSLLMGFLDFYGNHFDPRATGISVRCRQYFARANDYRPGSYQGATQPGMWTPPLPNVPQQVRVSPAPPVSIEYLRQNSILSDTGSVDGGRRNQRPPRYQAPAAALPYLPHKQVPGHADNGTNNSDHYRFGHGRPFTFDPLFVEDPLSSGNNVGRNAFRIIQIQRAFSDAHRALVASLEWDIHSSGELNDGVEYPLLKCLLRNRDVLYEL